MALPSSLIPPSAAPGTQVPALADPELIARARRGEHEAREELAQRCRRPAYLLALQLLGDPDDALDVAQDALLRFFTSLDRFQPSRPLRPWLATIVRNRARDLLRRRRRHRLEPLEGPEGTMRPEVVDTSPGPEAGAARRELQVRLWKALSALNEAQREILVLRDYQDLTYDEIARVLAVPIGTVMSRLHRARRALRERLEEYPNA
jgi:RNA polymerase sigma-70 factor (ECF subfamily)